MMEKLFQHNGWLKVFSVALAILLWVMVMPNYTANASKVFDVPLTVIPHPTYKVFSGDQPPAVQVRAEGKNLVISHLKPEDFKATVDYSQVTEPGKPLQLEVKVEGPPRLQAQYTLSVIPKTLIVTLVENRDASVPVTVEPASGIVMYNQQEYRYTARMQKDQVEISGRNDYLSQVRQARVYLDSGDLIPRNNQVEKTVVPVDASGKAVDNLVVPKVVVDLRWEELPPGKLVKVDVPTVGSLPPGYVLNGIAVEPVAITVRSLSRDGKTPDGASLQTAPLDLTGKTKSFTTSLRVSPPNGATIAIDAVDVRVDIGESLVERTFAGLPITVSHTLPNADVSLSVRTVSLHLKGPYSVMTPLDAGTVIPYIDVEGLREGRQIVPVKVKQPPGITELTIDPAVVEVTVSTH